MDTSNIWKVLNSYFRDNPQNLVNHHIESYNDFYKKHIFQIFRDKNPIRIQSMYDEELGDFKNKCLLYLGGKDGSRIYFGKPIIYDEGRPHFMYPNEARLRNMNYAMTIHYDVEVEFIRTLSSNEEPDLYGGSDVVETQEGGDDEFESDEEVEPEQIKKGGAKTDILKRPPRKKPSQKKKSSATSPAEVARIRETTQASFAASTDGNIIQRSPQPFVIEKILLGKFPIMVQSDFCVLNSLPKDLRFQMGECRNDNGGYFIIDGKEKSVIPQEKFADNTLYVQESSDDKYLYSAEIRSVSENVAKPMKSLSVKIRAPASMNTGFSQSKVENLNIVVAIKNVRKPIPLFIVFRALGFITDKQIIQMCLLNMEKYKYMVDLFIPSVHEAGGIMTQHAALRFIAVYTKGKTIPHVLEILCDYFLPHIGETNYTAKAYYLGYIVFQLLKVYLKIEEPTNRDNFKYKRIETVGSLMTDLFREYFTIQSHEIQQGFEQRMNYNLELYENDHQSLIREYYKEVFSQRTVDSGFKKAFKGNWGAQSHTKRIGIVQDLNRLSFYTAASQLRKTNIHLDAGAKLVGPRVLHASHWGFFDPIDTPDGGNIGIHKHLALSAYITKGIPREPVILWLREKVALKLLEECSCIQLDTMTKLFLNGLWVGVVENPVDCVDKVKLFRRNALLPIYVSISFDIKKNHIIMYSDAGRLCRPIFYKDKETNKFSFESPEFIKALENDEITWTNLVSGFNEKKDEKFHTNNMKIYELQELYGIKDENNPAKLEAFIQNKAVLDYIDTSESEDTLIALNKQTIKNNKRYTHAEIHESLIFGMMCNLINFPENNPATRNSFSCGQSKQAASIYHTNYQVRMDKSAVVLNNGQIPLVKTRYMEHFNQEENVYGENCVVAIMCYTGYNVEDAVLINEGALQRGLFRTTYYTTYETHEERTKTEDQISETIFSNIENTPNVIGIKSDCFYDKLDSNGLIKEGTPVNDKTVLIGMTTAHTGMTHRQDASKTPKKGQLGIVDKSFITEGEEGKRIAKVRVREIRIPAIGDKMASRAGQKGTVGLVVPETDMPFTRNGVRPDIIINPHAIPTRMTIGHLVEAITGKVAATYGGFADCTAFSNDASKIKAYGQLLTREGFHSSGNEILYNGMTGEQVQSEIFIGPTFYMRLKHMVKDKVNYRARGPRAALTRQTVGGRANDGGLRIGEMERDSIISHGATNFLTESMMERGDEYYMAICNKSGMISVYNPSKNLFLSPMADGPLQFVGSLAGNDMKVVNISKFGRDFSIICIPYTFKLLIQELQVLNMTLRVVTEDSINHLEELSFSKNINKLSHLEHLETKETISKIQHDIREALKKKDPTDDLKNKSVDQAFDIPDAEEEATQLPHNDYPIDSPPYAPSSPEWAPPRDDDDEPRFAPSSPEWAPPRDDDDDEPEFAQLTPEWEPDSLMGGAKKKDDDENKEFAVGDDVILKNITVDPVTQRPIVYKIKKIGPEFITIETNNPHIQKDNVLVVEPNEITYPFTIDPSLYQTQQQQQQMFNRPLLTPQPLQPMAPPMAAPNITVVVGDKNEVHGNDGNDPTNTNTSGSINMKDVREPEQKEKKAEEKDEKKEESSGSILDFTKSFFVKKA
tara:strand:+ start:11642 stop:16501 length:4860 start_codon:yes stop_codon:yes gene_type:complete